LDVNTLFLTYELLNKELNNMSQNQFIVLDFGQTSVKNSIYFFILYKRIHNAVKSIRMH
jgi:hypothetical protein